MKKILAVLAFAFLITGCSDVPSGYVGIKVNLLGSEKGVDLQELGTGRYWIGINEKLYTFPVFSQNQVWTKDSNEGSPNDDSVTFNTEEGLSVNTDIGISYSIDPKRVSLIFQKYRKGIDEITSIYMRSMVRDALVAEASSRSMESIYGRGKTDFIAAVQHRVISQTEPLGIIVEKIYLIGELRLPQSVISSINAKIEATQKTAQRENEVAQSKAEADKLEQTARGEANSKLLLAEAEAKAIKIKGDALSANPKLVELSAVEKWNGVLPQYMMGSTTPFINMSSK